MEKMIAYCPNCGQPNAQRQPNLFVCPNNHHNWLDAVPGATTYIIKGNNVLFGVRSGEPQKGGLCIAGGFINLGETAEQAAVREAKEELNVDVDIVGFVGTYTSDYDGKLVLNITFVAEYKGGDIIPGDDMNGGEPTWRAIDNLPAAHELSWSWQVAAQKDLITWFQTRGV
jgi:NADH pyrophosphatase NudC (nudix superfamily)